MQRHALQSPTGHALAFPLEADGGRHERAEPTLQKNALTPIPTPSCAIGFRA